MKGSDDSSYSHGRRGKGLSHNSLHLGRSGTRCLIGCRFHLITISQGQCGPHTSGNGGTGIIDLIAQKDARQYVCAVINLIYGKEHRLGILETSEVQT